jgi:Ala-tRNA(Pro) deacylase
VKQGTPVLRRPSQLFPKRLRFQESGCNPIYTPKRAYQSGVGVWVMALSTSLQRFFERHGVQATSHDHAPGLSLNDVSGVCGIDPEQVLVPVLLQSEKKALMMAVVPLSRLFDVERVNALLRRQFARVDARTTSSIFYDAEPGAEPPFGEAYRVPCLIERSLLNQDRLYFRGGSLKSLVSVSGDDFRFLMSSAPKAVISNERALVAPAPVPTPSGAHSADAIRASLEKIYRLPPMPPDGHEDH